MTSVTITQVRRRCGDLNEPYLFTDSAVYEAIEAALDYLALKKITPATALEIRLHSLKAADFLLSDFMNNLQSRPVASMSEQGSSVSFVDISTQSTIVKAELARLFFELQGTFYDVGDAGDYDPGMGL